MKSSLMLLTPFFETRQRDERDGVEGRESPLQERRKNEEEKK
jgi:hypothetical protein